MKIRPIDANALEKVINSLEPFELNDDEICCVLTQIRRQPTLDYEPVRHGEWVRANEAQVYFDVEYICSECEFTVAVSGIGTPLLYGYNHCPNCGAKMRKGDA